MWPIKLCCNCCMDTADTVHQDLWNYKEKERSYNSVFFLDCSTAYEGIVILLSRTHSIVYMSTIAHWCESALMWMLYIFLIMIIYQMQHLKYLAWIANRKTHLPAPYTLSWTVFGFLLIREGSWKKHGLFSLETTDFRWDSSPVYDHDEWVTSDKFEFCVHNEILAMVDPFQLSALPAGQGETHINLDIVSHTLARGL